MIILFTLEFLNILELFKVPQKVAPALARSQQKESSELGVLMADLVQNAAVYFVNLDEISSFRFILSGYFTGFKLESRLDFEQYLIVTKPAVIKKPNNEELLYLTFILLEPIQVARSFFYENEIFHGLIFFEDCFSGLVQRHGQICENADHQIFRCLIFPYKIFEKEGKRLHWLF